MNFAHRSSVDSTYSPQVVHFMLKGAISRTVCTRGPAGLGPFFRVNCRGSKSGG